MRELRMRSRTYAKVEIVQTYVCKLILKQIIR